MVSKHRSDSCGDCGTRLTDRRRSRQRLLSCPLRPRVGQLKRIGENEMNHKAVEKLENKLEDAIAEVFKAMSKKKIPMVPDHHTLKMLANMQKLTSKIRTSPKSRNVCWDTM